MPMVVVVVGGVGSHRSEQDERERSLPRGNGLLLLSLQRFRLSGGGCKQVCVVKCVCMQDRGHKGLVMSCIHTLVTCTDAWLHLLCIIANANMLVGVHAHAHVCAHVH